MTAIIGTLKESSLHAALKQHYATATDRIEVAIDGFWVDILGADATGEPRRIVEIQTGNFSALRPKLETLLDRYPVTVVYPVAKEKFIQRVKTTSGGEEIPISRRKSPKRGREEEIFGELIYLPEVVGHPHFSLRVAMIREIQIWRDDGRGSWRRRGVSVVDRRLESVLDEQRFFAPGDFLRFIPDTLAEPFTVKELAACSGLSTYLTGKMVYSLRRMDALRFVGKRGNAHLYVRRESFSE